MKFKIRQTVTWRDQESLVVRTEGKKEPISAEPIVSKRCGRGEV
jgi:hypothetical protein